MLVVAVSTKRRNSQLIDQACNHLIRLVFSRIRQLVGNGEFVLVAEEPKTILAQLIFCIF